MISFDYSDPVAKLLTYGDCRDPKSDWPNYPEELGISSSDISELIRMATDLELNQLDGEQTECWASLHAWRTLGQLKATAAIEPLMSLFHSLQDYDWIDEWMSHEMPYVYALIGKQSIPALRTYLADTSHSTYPRATANNCLRKIALTIPDTRNECISAITSSLEGEDPELNAFTIVSLIDLKAVESMPVIERAFERGQVDESICGYLDDIKFDMGLKPAQTTSQQRRAKEKSLFQKAASTSIKITQAESSAGFGKAIGKDKTKKKKKKKKK